MLEDTQAMIVGVPGASASASLLVDTNPNKMRFGRGAGAGAISIVVWSIDSSETGLQGSGPVSRRTIAE